MTFYQQSYARAACSLSELTSKVPAAAAGLERPFARHHQIGNILLSFVDLYVSPPNARPIVHATSPLQSPGRHVAMMLPQGLKDEEVFWHEVGHVVESLCVPFLALDLPEPTSEAFASWFALHAMDQAPEPQSAEAVVAALYAGLDKDVGSVLWALAEAFAANGDRLSWKAD
jgi:hypothetical protein